MAERLRPIYRDAKRGLGQARSASEVADVTQVGDFWLEAKHHARVNIPRAMAQAIAAMKPGQIPLVIAKNTGKPPELAVLRFDDFLKLLDELERYRRHVDLELECLPAAATGAKP